MSEHMQSLLGLVGGFHVPERREICCLIFLQDSAFLNLSNVCEALYVHFPSHRSECFESVNTEISWFITNGHVLLLCYKYYLGGGGGVLHIFNIFTAIWSVSCLDWTWCYFDVCGVTNDLNCTKYTLNVDLLIAIPWKQPIMWLVHMNITFMEVLYC